MQPDGEGVCARSSLYSAVIHCENDEIWREAKRLGRGEGHRYDAMREIEIPEGPDSASATVKNRRQELQRV